MREGFAELPALDNYGGLVSFVPKQDLDAGQAAQASNIEFVPGGCASRIGFKVQSTIPFDSVNASNAINTIFGYPKQDGTRVRIVLSDVGTLYTEYPEGTLAAVETHLGRNMIMKGCALFNQAFLAFSDGLKGVARVRKLDQDGNLYPVAQQGISLNATFTATAGVGTVSTVGDHVAVLVIETTDGFITAPTTLQNAVIGAGQKYVWSAIPLGPANTKRRRFYLTPDGGSVTELYTHPALWVNDNTTTTLTVDIDDTTLQNEGTLLTATERLRYPLPPALGVTNYSGRLIAWGALNILPTYVSGDGITRYGFGNLSFDGGSIAGVPNGWTVSSAGGALVDNVTAPGCGLNAWQITGTGAPGDTGKLVSAYNTLRTFDYPFAKTFKARLRVKKSSTLTAGQLEVGLQGLGFSFRIQAADISTDWTWVEGTLLSTTAAAGYPLYFCLNQSGGNPPLNSLLTVGEIEIFDSKSPSQRSIVWASNLNDADGFDIAEGFQNVNVGDGQAVMTAWELNGSLYYGKERSLWSTIDNGDVFSNWPINNVSYQTGVISVHGAAYGDRWMALASHDGLYFFQGGEPEKLSQEIQPEWDRINPSYYHLVWVAVDVRAKRIVVGAPLDLATTCSHMFVLDYVDGVPDGLHTNPMFSGGRGRKWSIWPVALKCGVYAERDNGSRTMMYGKDAGAGIASIVRQDSTGAQRYDTFGADPVAIHSIYETAPLGAPMGRSKFGFLAMKIRGQGTLLTSLVRPGGTTVAMQSLTLSNTSDHDLELQPDHDDTQIGLMYETNALTGDWFSLKRMALYAKDHPYAPIRGHNTPT